MPFDTAEEVSLDWWTEDPAACRFEFLGQWFTVENRGLELHPKGRVTVIVRLPRDPGKYPYKWSDGVNIESGHLRVRAATPPRPAEAPEPTSGYTGPGSSRRRGRRGRT